MFHIFHLTKKLLKSFQTFIIFLIYLLLQIVLRRRVLQLEEQLKALNSQAAGDYGNFLKLFESFN